MDSLSIFGLDLSGNAVVIRVIRRHHRVAEAWVYLRTSSGQEYVLPNQPNASVYDTDGRSFSVAGIRVEVLEPLKIWRVGFNGILRKGIRETCIEHDDGSDEVVVKFNFIWHPFYSYSAFPKDINVSLLANRLSEKKWSRDFFSNWNMSSNEWHEQWGEMHGIVSIEGTEDATVLLRGSKNREYGIVDWTTVKRKAVLKCIGHDGTALHLYTESTNDEPLRLTFGQVMPPSNIILFEIDNCQLNASDNLFSSDARNKIISIRLTASKRKYVIGFEMSSDGFVEYLGRDWERQVRVMTAKVILNGKEGVGLVELYQSHSGGCSELRPPTAVLLSEPDISSTDRLFLPLHDPKCRSSKLVGGKGASLALMTALNQHSFRVPAGLCVTRTSFEQHVQQYDTIQQALVLLHDVSWKRRKGSLQDECKKTVETITKTKLSPGLINELSNELELLFGSRYDTVRFAVRSSAVGEDGEELSAAGQNETFLGVIGLDHLSEAVIRCWASQFSYRSVEYKRQHGQLLNGGMGVVIQEMVPAEAAGVLFSRDPMTGSANKMLITANYGLGESVVSASADPDTVTLRRTFNNDLRLQDVQVGKKAIKIVMDDDNSGTREIHSSSSDTDGHCAISEELSLRLGAIAVHLEKCFGSARDIEWAVLGGTIYLLQSRPMTSESVLTDHEVLHEFDIAMRTTYEKYSTANVAEVMPGALSPLNITGLNRTQFSHFQHYQKWRINTFRFDTSVVEGTALFYNHMFFDMVQQRAMDLKDKKSFMTKSSELGIYGRSLDDEDVLAVARGRFDQIPPGLAMLMIKLLVPGILFPKRVMRAADKKYKNYPIPTDGATAAMDAYSRMSTAVIDSSDILMKHLQVTFGSSMINAMVLYLLSGNSPEFTLEHYSDFATLIGNSNGALSGDVPRNLKQVADAIRKEIVPTSFTDMSKDDALNWIRTEGTASKAAFEEFLKQHGHRCINEFDVKSLSWGMKPTSVIEMLQTMLLISDGQKENAKSSTVQDAVNGIKTKLTPMRRRLLIWLLGASRALVCHREYAKSLLVFYMDRMRLAYRTLAQLMIKEGFLPEEELIFLMTHEEVERLMLTRSPRIILRAKRRMRLFDEMHRMQFPEMITGLPQPVNKGGDTTFRSLGRVRGFPVCQGTVKGVARVIVDFSGQANTIRPGDILVTHATDIGWSPYFPMLGGVVTEIGGLISHGAVVAREYGLPCIICAENATKVFESGDIVFLDATNGTIDKVEEE